MKNTRHLLVVLSLLPILLSNQHRVYFPLKIIEFYQAEM
jgi:hypothetical protein